MPLLNDEPKVLGSKIPLSCFNRDSAVDGASEPSQFSISSATCSEAVEEETIDRFFVFVLKLTSEPIIRGPP